MPSAPLTFEGSISVMAALEAGRRPIEAIYVQAGKDIRGLDRIRAAARKQNVPLKEVAEAELGALAAGRSHGGILAIAGPRVFQSLDELVANQPAAFIAMLEGVEDPYNYGQAIRALYAAGAHGLVVSARNWDTALATVARASAGASEYMLTAQVAKPEEAIAFFKSHGFRVAATAKEKKAASIYDAGLGGDLFILIGGEHRGLPSSVLSACDTILSIPYGRQFSMSLDVTSSTAAIAFEIMRQRLLSKLELR